MRGGVRAAWRGLDRAVAGAGGRARAEGKRPVDSRFRAANLQSVPRRILPRPQPSGAPRADRGESPGDRRSRQLGAPLLVLVCGAAPDRDLDAARAMVARGIEKIADYARQRRVRLGIEPLHPMFAADRSVIVTLGQALDLAEPFDPELAGVILDV